MKMTAASAAAPVIAGVFVRRFTGRHCAVQLCTLVSSRLMSFRSGNGNCNHLDGTCQCLPGYEGVSCDTAPNRMYRESWGLFFSICLLGTVFIGIVCASMTRLRAVPEPFIAIVLGLLIGVAFNVFSINPGTLRNMQVHPPPPPAIAFSVLLIAASFKFCSPADAL